jgi:hypothetical protein
MNKFVLRNDTNHNSEQFYITNGEEQPDETANILEENDANLDANQNTESEHPGNIDEQASSFDIYDPRTWNVAALRGICWIVLISTLSLMTLRQQKHESLVSHDYRSLGGLFACYVSFPMRCSFYHT